MLLRASSPGSPRYTTRHHRVAELQPLGMLLAAISPSQGQAPGIRGILYSPGDECCLQELQQAPGIHTPSPRACGSRGMQLDRKHRLPLSAFCQPRSFCSGPCIATKW